ncbi:unnamed protein product [Paramecium primaurelia]|uniref:Ribosomal protein L33 n=4 Tax=Paramecium TaxID=5884 RepID=A0E2K7_PARTE|nr:uncharacterized protein GSPATT00022696001 [Paramecium tetraurelia]CAD8066542.1 unnamed protein product [Paramecium primaurelia]CAD8191220.1 unnamed protein product [Paramecium pentaurelia]CAD8195032.1 unnamed protein product [Paramecium octaurelia]CAD8200934.1 unnamed protein product [Paramecium octaurelia]CAK89524.1 unnamed protein product [Paramecium tetraurelia]|eukprot:XP_001456921.1 hypothetical protein (macronuclear) [Paramecium tetraurelia strain d4-2]
MGKKTTLLFKLVSSAGTGFYYYGEKSTKKVGSKLILRKYDPLVNQYVIFTEAKLASGKKK